MSDPLSGSLHRPYRAPLFTELPVLGLTPQAISHHPCGVLDLMTRRSSRHFRFLSGHCSLPLFWRELVLYSGPNVCAPLRKNDSTKARMHESTKCRAPLLQVSGGYFVIVEVVDRTDRLYAKVGGQGLLDLLDLSSDHGQGSTDLQDVVDRNGKEVPIENH